MKGSGIVLLALAAGVAGYPAAAGGAQDRTPRPGREFWQMIRGTPAATSPAGANRSVRPRRFHAFSLNRPGLAALVARAPRERTRVARERPLVLSLPSPEGGFQRFTAEESPVMEPALAAKHPEIKTYSGRGIDDPAASVRFDLTPLGFHASVRSPHGAWYIDPYYHREQTVYASYYGRDLERDPADTFVERSPDEAELSIDRGSYRPAETVQLHGFGFAAGAAVSVTVSDPEGRFPSFTAAGQADGDGAFDVEFTADANANLGTHRVEATDGAETAAVTYEVVTADDVSHDPPVGDQLRTYRLALLTDPFYATYFGAENVTAAKVTLINRVTQVYEAETSIRMVLIANNDVLNLDTNAQMTGTSGPCGGAACYTATQASTCGGSTLTRTRQVIGLLVGASNFDIGHIALGAPGGGVASLGVVGANNKAQGCTGLTTPTGDFFAVDYVAHEMGHQFAGNHTFNGTQSNCSGGNRSAANSVEPGSGSSIMAYAGICQTDNLQPHSDPYWSARSLDEITTYTSGAEVNINEVQMAALTGFDTDGDSFVIRFEGNDSVPIVRGVNYNAAGIAAAVTGITGWPAGGIATATAISDNAFTLTFTGTLAGMDISLLSLESLAGASGYSGEIAKGGATTRRGVVAPTGNTIPVVTAPAQYTIPIRTPFALTGSATDADGDPLTYMWEQVDRGGTTGTGLVNNTKLNGPLFRQFGKAAIVTPTDTLLYGSPGENAADTNPTRVFPDMDQILANNTNAETGECPAGNGECFSEFLPTAAYVGFSPVNASPLALHFRLTARDGRPNGGGVNNAQTTLLLTPTAGPFLVTSPNVAGVYPGNSSQTVTWSVANTDIEPISTANVKISLSADGGHTYPYVLAETTPNDGSEAVTLPNVHVDAARIKVEAVENVFFDVNNASFSISAVPVVTHDVAGGAVVVQYSDPLPVPVTISASDSDTPGSGLTAVAAGLPAGLSLVTGSTSDGETLPGARSWTIAGHVAAAAGTYGVVVTVTDGTGNTGTASFTVIVDGEDASTAYAGDELAFTAPGATSATVLLRATVRDAGGDPAPGDITTATVTFKEGDATLCGPVAVALLGADPATGAASCSAPLEAGAHTVDVIVGGTYTATAAGHVAVVEADQARVTGSGAIVVGASGGKYAADAGSKLHFSFRASYSASDPPPPLQGQATVTFTRAGRTYQLKSTALQALGTAFQTPSGEPCAGPANPTCLGRGNLRARASLNDITNRSDPVHLGVNFSLELAFSDDGGRGAWDTIGVTVWNGARLIFSSGWDGAQTLETELKSGNIVVN